MNGWNLPKFCARIVGSNKIVDNTDSRKTLALFFIVINSVWGLKKFRRKYVLFFGKVYKEKVISFDYVWKK